MVAIKAQVPIKPLGLYSAMFIMSWCLFLSPSASYSRSNFVSNYLSLTIALAESVQDGQIGEEAEIGSTNKVMYDKDTVTGSAEAEEEWLWEEDDMQGTLSSVTENLRAQDAVWVLSSGNITEVLQHSPVPLVMVYVHANWCGYCKDLTPEYRYAALLLLAMKAPVRLAMMDGPSNRAWVDAHSSVVKGYPSLLVYRNGVYVTSYKGHYSFRAIASFLLSKLGRLVDHVESPGDLEEAMASATTAGAAVDEIAASISDASSRGAKRDEIRGGVTRRSEVAGHEVRLLGLCIPSALLNDKESQDDKPADADLASRLINNLEACPGMLDFFEAAEQRAVGTLSVRSLRTVADALNAASAIPIGRRPRLDKTHYVPNSGRISYFGGRDREPLPFSLTRRNSGMFFTPMWSDSRLIFDLFKDQIMNAWSSVSTPRVEGNRTFVILALRSRAGSETPIVASTMFSPTSTDEVLRFEASFHAPVIVRFQNSNLPYVEAFAKGVQVLVFSPGLSDNDVYSVDFTPNSIKSKDETILDIKENFKRSRTSEAVWASVGSLLLHVIAQVAQEYRGKAVFIHVPTSEYHLYRLFEMPNPSDESFVPKIIILNLTDPGAMLKYVMNSKPISAAIEDLALIHRKPDVPQWRIIDFRQQLQTLMSDFFAGKLSPSHTSEVIDEEGVSEIEFVKRLTANTFRAAVEEKGLSVYLIAFVAPWCGHCKALEPVLNDLGKVFRRLSDTEPSDVSDLNLISENIKTAARHVKIGRVDATRNEVAYPGVRVLGFPTIYAFVHNQSNYIPNNEGAVKSHQPYVKEFIGPRTFDSLSAFIFTMFDGFE